MNLFNIWKIKTIQRLVKLWYKYSRRRIIESSQT